MDEAMLDVLRSVDTPTVCNAIEAVQESVALIILPKAQWWPQLQSQFDPDEKAVVGYALTAKVAASAAPQEPADETKRGGWHITSIWLKASSHLLLL